MTVKELIKELEKVNPDLDVFAYDEDGESGELIELYVDDKKGMCFVER